MSRIVAGSGRGRRLAMPNGKETRPTTDRVREALFASLEADFGTLDGLAFLDLYAGSGAVGLEALSRGARTVLLVEQHKAAAAIIRRNLAALPESRRRARLEVRSVERLVATTAPTAFDIAFLDPPYAATTETVAEVIGRLATSGWLHPDASVVVERATRSGPFDWPAGFVGDRERRYGDTTLWYGRTD